MPSLTKRGTGCNISRKTKSEASGRNVWGCSSIERFSGLHLTRAVQRNHGHGCERVAIRKRPYSLREKPRGTARRESCNKMDDVDAATSNLLVRHLHRLVHLSPLGHRDQKDFSECGVTPLALYPSSASGAVMTTTTETGRSWTWRRLYCLQDSSRSGRGCWRRACLWQAFHLVSRHSCSLASLLFPS